MSQWTLDTAHVFPLCIWIEESFGNNYFLPYKDLVLVGTWSWQQGAKGEPTTEGDWRQQGETGHETVKALAYANWQG